MVEGITNPEIEITKKEYDFYVWVSKKNGYDNVSKFIKNTLLEYCKDYLKKYKEEKKRKEEMEIEKKMEDEEIDKEKLMGELIESGDLEAAQKYDDRRISHDSKSKKEVSQ